MPKLWFPVGEQLTYDMNYGVLNVGTTKVTTEWINEEGRTLLSIRFVTRTSRLFDHIYRVDDVVESVIDPATFRPLRMHKKLHEGDFRSEEVTTFDYATGTAHWMSMNSNKTKDYRIGDETRDVVSFMFFMRKGRLQDDQLGSYWVAGDNGMCIMNLKRGSTRELSLPGFGKVKALRIMPQVGKDTLFVRKLPRDMWVSTDGRQVIVRMTVKVPVASVDLVLRNVGGPGDDFWTRKSTGSKDRVLAHDD